MIATSRTLFAACMSIGLTASGAAFAQSNNTSNNTSTNTSSDPWSSNSSSNSSTNSSRSREGVRDYRSDERIDERGRHYRYQLREFLRKDDGVWRRVIRESGRYRDDGDRDDD